MMKHSLLLFLLFTRLFSFDDFDYALDVDKRELVMKEAMTLTFSLSQKNTIDVMNFDFIIPPSDVYHVELIEDEESKDSKGRVHMHSKYLLYPLKVGNFSLKPHLIIKKASKEELKKFVTGSADELMYLRTRNQDIVLDSIDISVKVLERNVTLVGDYTLSYTIDKQKIAKAEQVNVVYTLSGRGYKPELRALLDMPADVDAFMDREVYDKNIFHKVIFNYALGGSSDFVIPKISLLAYNPKSAEYYTLSAPKREIKVEIEREQHPIMIEKNAEIDWWRYLNYLLLFVAGYLTQKSLKYLPRSSLCKEEVFIQSVKRQKSAKGMLKLLLVEDSNTFKTEIEKLEGMIYHDSDYSLAALKDEFLKRYLSQKSDDIITT